jgi:glycosyltransferase involved in cell wall biosynthesis
VEKFGLPTTSRLSTLSPKKYRVTFVNDLGPQFGAGIAHGRLQESLDAAGHETSFVFAKANGSTLSKTDSMLYEEIEKTSPDLVVFGNLHNASLGIGLVDWISERWPTCFVMHDLWLATGRCCYLGSCEKFKTNCDQSCPTAAEYPAAPVERIESLFDNKLRVISKPRKIVVLANSPWTARIAEQSAITRRGVVKTLKYGFPLHIFKPRDKNLCREILGLPIDAFIVLFASVNVAEERKGLRHLFEALNRLQLKNLVPVCIGHAHDHAELYPGTVALGYIEDPWRSALVYAAADIFAGPSLQEAFGQVFIEAAACGTPSVAYPVGGVENSIVHGVTGLLAARVHPSALADEIHRLYRDDEYRRQLGVWGRMEVENEWSYRSAYHRFNNILRQVPEHIGFLPPANIAFDPAKTAGISRLATPGFGILEKAETSVAPATGFGSKENLRLPSGTQHAVHWAIGNVCQIRVRIPGSQSKSLMATCFNPIAQQTISVSVDGQKLESIEIRNRDNFFEPIQVCLASEIAPGDHLVQLRFAKTIKEQSGTRDLAMLFADLELQPIRKERQEPGVAA